MGPMAIAVCRALALIVLCAAACGGESQDSASASAPAPAASSDAAYHEDVRRICNAEELSGALEEDPNRRAIIVAQWLGNNVVTQEARSLLAQQARLPPKGKRELLLAEAKKAGLPGCKTAEAWQ